MRFIILFILAAGCNTWEGALHETKCSKEEFEKVVLETNYCIEKTSYSRTYCLASSMVRNCKRIIK